ncbi:MAG: flagellar brake protein [Nitrospinae bacterium]|nr:flagellar brake protein [Nitrospinota bacterium]
MNSAVAAESGAKTKLELESLCAVGEPMSVEWKGIKYPTTFRGAKENTYVFADITSGGGKPIMQIAEQGYLLVDVPMADGKPAPMEFNSSVVVRFLSEGVVYGFKTFFLRIHPKAGLVVLEYPNNIEKFCLRKSKRINVMVPVEVGNPSAPARQNGAILDVSAVGARVALDKRDGWDVGSTLSLFGALPDGKGISGLSGLIKSVRENCGKFHLGLNFAEGDSAPARAVAQYYQKCLGYV